MTRAYPPVEQNPNFPDLEQKVAARWTSERTFERSIEQRKEAGAKEFVFYDGPPFANGLPHYGHLVTGFVKDLVPRYQTMKGKAVDRRFGWDCHGLPAELHSEKELNLSGRHSIVEYGIERFNAHCRRSVLQFTDDWEYYVTRQGRWVDFRNDYKTMDRSFMESVLWAFKTLWDKGLIYEGYRVVPYSWAVQTPLSNFETRLDNSYRMRQDPALTVGFSLEKAPGEEIAPKLYAWTTTPWTLPSNLALAVAPDADYAVLAKGEERAILAQARIEAYAKELDGYEVVGTIKGSELVGRRYTPLFPFFESAPNAFQVIAGDFVELDGGTGVVHLAPAFGEDDMRVATAAGIPVIDPVDLAGNFTDQVPPYAGKNVFEANKDIIRDLKEAGRVLRHESYDHSYPHCWRTDQPLIYKAVQSWYVKVTAFRDRMAELNQGIKWVPDHVRDGLFGKWLENAHDWNISRNRFWGSPLPVWKSDDPAYPRIDVYGSIEELERDFGVKLEDLHRPAIDQLTRPNPDDPTGKSTMRRIEDVFDCWFESGSMPFAQVHYPFENKEWFEGHFPGDFIVEYVAQTRGWFYTLMVLSTALFDRAPFKSCICHGVVLDENKQKLSKRLKNYPDPVDVFNTHGADALRWYMVSSPLLAGGDLAMPKDGRAIAETVRQVMLPLWNAFYFFTLYANTDGYEATFRTDAAGELDRYVLAKTGDFVRAVEGALDDLDIPRATAAYLPFIDTLNNWYIRRSRDRFWGAEITHDKRDAYDTLYTVLVTASRALAPFLPFLTEHMHAVLCDGASVHLADWPDANALPADAELVRRMDLAREVCSAALSIRTDKGLRVRQPLRTLTIAYADCATLEPMRDLIADEVNVKAVELVDDPGRFGKTVVAVDPKVGKRLGKALGVVRKAGLEGAWTPGEEGRVVVEGAIIEPGEFQFRFEAKGGVDAMPFASGTGVVVLDTALDEGLEREGVARDLIRLVQTARKDAGLDVADRIVLELRGEAGAREDVSDFEQMVAGETLASAIRWTEGTPAGFVSKGALKGGEIEIGVAKAG
ncbi:isoleucine--tRNA ligase [Salinarimonas sp.]|uniref:isoleucine--tRNA ligase n=1 Tax=Salinarimonas sp. TaxID=2766526 RepID=UPI0032D98B47